MFFFSNFLLSELDWEFLRIVLFKTKLDNVLISFSFKMQFVFNITVE